MTPRDDARTQRQETRFRLSRVLLFVVVAVCLAQIGWWIYFQIRESGREYELRTRVGESAADAADDRARRIRMAIGEGGFLAAALLGGVVSLYWLMKRELQREYEQNQLLAAVTHDFRSPLTTIRLLAQTFELGRANEADRERLARTLVANVRRLEDLVENVLAAARLHAGRLTAAIEPVDLAAEVEKSLEQRRVLLDDRHVALTTALEPGVAARADRSLLQSVLGNLLENAIKYSDGAPAIEVCVARRGGNAELSVQDHGVGFAPAQSERIFERFHRGSAEQESSRPGLGLGLYLAREIVRLFGGTVTATSEGPGLGARFTVALPLAAGASP